MLNTKLNQYVDRFWQYLANRVFPKRLIYWCFIRGAVIATTQEYADTSPSELDIMTAAGRLDGKARQRTH